MMEELSAAVGIYDVIFSLFLMLSGVVLGMLFVEVPAYQKVGISFFLFFAAIPLLVSESARQSCPEFYGYNFLMRFLVGMFYFGVLTGAIIQFLATKFVKHLNRAVH